MHPHIYDPRNDGPLYRYRPRRKNMRTVTTPERVSPHVKLVFNTMARSRISYDDLEAASGIRRASIKAWRRKNAPGLESLTAVLNAMGWVAHRCAGRRRYLRRNGSVRIDHDRTTISAFGAFQISSDPRRSVFY
ncbi:MAG: hypothetical protein WBB98_03945 [Xanthobacteraceae bacterium]